MPHPHSLPAIAPTHGRHDMYAFVHKALRQAQCEMLIRIGQTDFDSDDLKPLLGDLRQLLTNGSQHISHEEIHVHAAIELRDPRATGDVQAQHDSHRQSFRQLEELIVRVEAAGPEARKSLGRQLYLTYSAFIAHDFEHMLEEETEMNARLWKHFDDFSLVAIEGGIKMSLTPEKTIQFMRLMIPALSRDERVVLLSEMQALAPKPAFAAVMELAARATLAPACLANLERRLGIEDRAMA